MNAISSLILTLALLPNLAHASFFDFVRCNKLNDGGTYCRTNRHQIKIDKQGTDYYFELYTAKDGITVTYYSINIDIDLIGTRIQKEGGIYDEQGVKLDTEHNRDTEYPQPYGNRLRTRLSPNIYEHFEDGKDIELNVFYGPKVGSDFYPITLKAEDMKDFASKVYDKIQETQEKYVLKGGK